MHSAPPSHRSPLSPIHRVYQKSYSSMAFFIISDKNYLGWIYFHEKILKKCWPCSKLLKISLFPLAQCCSKPEKAMTGSAGQVWASTCATNILQINFAPFLLVTIINTLPEVAKCPPIHINSYIVFQRITMRYHQFFKKDINIFLF